MHHGFDVRFAVSSLAEEGGDFLGIHNRVQVVRRLFPSESAVQIGTQRGMPHVACLNEHWFGTLAGARQAIEAWRGITTRSGRIAR